MEKLKKIWQNKVFYVLMVLVLVFLTPITGRPAESELRAVVATLGIDLAPNGVEITVGVLSAKGEADIISNLDPVSANGESVDIAIYNLGVKLGKKVGLSHCEYIVFSEEMFEEDVTIYLDFFIRTNNLTTNAVLVATQGKAKDLINAATSKDSPYNTSIKNMIIFNDDFLFATNMNVETFYNAYYGYEGISILGVFDAMDESEIDEIEDGPDGQGQEEAVGKEGLNESGFSGDEDNKEQDSATEQGDAAGDANTQSGNNESSSGGGTGGTGGGTSAEESGDDEDKKEVVQYQANMLIVKNGKAIRKLTRNEVDYLKIYHHFIRTMFVKIDNVDTPEYKDASITFEIYDKRADSRVYYIDGVPVYKTVLKLSVKFDEVNAPDKTLDSLNEVGDVVLPNIKEEFIKKIEDLFAELIANAKKDKTDVLGIYSFFNKKYNKQWKEYIDSLEDKEAYLEGVVYEIEVQIETKL